MKKLLLFIALAAAGSLFVGCDSSVPENKTQSASSPKKWKIGVSIPAATHGWSGGVVWHAERAKEEMEKASPDAEFMIVTSSDAQDQVNRIENLMVRGADALVVMAQEPGPLLSVCEQARKKGVYLVIVSNPLSKDIQNVFVNGDNSGFGAAAAEAMGLVLKGQGNIVVMEGYSSPINTERMEAFRKTLAAKYPAIRILDSRLAYYSPEKALALMENYIQKYPDIDGVWAGDDDALLGAVKACEERAPGSLKIKAMVGGGGSRKIVKKIMDSDPLVKATVTYPPQIIQEGMKAALDGLRNGKMPPDGRSRITVPSRIVLRENAGEFYFPDSVY